MLTAGAAHLDRVVRRAIADRLPIDHAAVRLECAAMLAEILTDLGIEDEAPIYDALADERGAA